MPNYKFIKCNPDIFAPVALVELWFYQFFGESDRMFYRHLFYQSKYALSTVNNINHKSIVIALGGNAIIKTTDKGTAGEMITNINNAVSHILNIPKINPSSHYKICVTHGNGPQIGSIFLQNQLCSDQIPPLPLSVCGAMTQGYIGYLLQQSFINQLQQSEYKYKGASTIINQIGVLKNDPAFQNPSKPIGKFYNDYEAENLMNNNGYDMKKDSHGRGWRITVPSPKPLKIIELSAIKRLFDDDYIVITGGGGGIPVFIEDQSDHVHVQGVDAVIDKDLTSVLLAKELDADCLVIATDGDGIWINYHAEEKGKKIDKIQVNELKEYYENGTWDDYGGSMKPKIKAVIEFVEETGRDAIICALNNIDKGLMGQGGTRIFHDNYSQKQKFNF